MRRMYSEKELQRLVEVQKKDINTLVDKDGHARFIEGDLETEEITGITFSYAKWSLSGTHLMIVLAGEVANTTTISSGDLLGKLANLPSWIKDKIYPIFSEVVEFKSTYAFASDWTIQSINNSLRKTSNEIVIKSESTITFTANRTFRFSFDILIDDE